MKSLNQLRDECFTTAREHGFHDEPRSMDRFCALMHSEISELFEAYRAGKADEKCDKPILLTNTEEEMADIIIRVLDACGARRINIERAVNIKMEYNERRPYKHGKKF
jgi:NTP pyrophosphatase (non-canonical NTP hydrolase)